MSFAFVVTLADEGVVQLESCLGYLRSAYPDAPAAVVCDGAPDPGYRAACLRHRVHYVEGAYLKRIECGGRWWRRFFEVALKMKAKYLVKLDPDARVIRRFRGHPHHPISGTVNSPGTPFEHVQGGCQVFTHATAKRILASPLLDAEELCNRRTYAWHGPDDSRQIHALSYLSTDKSLVWLARNLGISWGDWPEVGSVWTPPAPEGDYAVTHPHKVDPPLAYLDAPLRVITTCKGRLDHLRQTLPTWISEPGVSVTVVDYDCPQRTCEWVREHHPSGIAVHARGVDRFNLSRARNLGALYSPPGWWCFFDADWKCSPGWAAGVRAVLRDRHYYLARPITWDQFGSVVVHSDDYRSAGGYDERFRAWGWEDGDFYARLRQVGTRPDSMPGRFFSSIKHAEADRTKFYDVKKVNASHSFYYDYTHRKMRFMLDVWRLPSPTECDALLQETCDRFGDSVPQLAYGCQDDPAPDVIVWTADTPPCRAAQSPVLPAPEEPEEPETAEVEPRTFGAKAPGAAAGPPETQDERGEPKPAAGTESQDSVTISREKDRRTGAPIVNVSVVVQNIGQDSCRQQQPDTTTKVA